MPPEDKPVEPSPQDVHKDEWTWTSWVPVRSKRWKRLGEKFWRVPGEIKRHRYGICKECEEFIPFTTQCRLCFCAMGIKTWYAGFSCPKGKWSAVTVPPEKRQGGDETGY
jgi:hypothetical protein